MFSLCVLSTDKRKKGELNVVECGDKRGQKENFLGFFFMSYYVWYTCVS